MALQVGAMKGDLKSIPVKYVLYNRDSIFIYDYCHHHFGNLDDLSLWSSNQTLTGSNLAEYPLFIFFFFFSFFIRFYSSFLWSLFSSTLKKVVQYWR